MVAKRAYAIRPYISRPMWWRYVQNANGSTGSDRLTAMDKPGHVPTSVSAAARLTDSLRSTTQWVVNVNVAHARARKPSSCPVIPRPEGTRQRRISSRFDVAQAGEISRVRARNDSAPGTLPNRQVSDDDPLNDVNEPFPPGRQTLAWHARRQPRRRSAICSSAVAMRMPGMPMSRFTNATLVSRSRSAKRLYAPIE